jgi:hypothetical protein
MVTKRQTVVRKQGSCVTNHRKSSIWMNKPAIRLLSVFRHNIKKVLWDYVTMCMHTRSWTYLWTFLWTHKSIILSVIFIFMLVLILLVYNKLANCPQLVKLCHNIIWSNFRSDQIYKKIKITRRHPKKNWNSPFTFCNLKSFMNNFFPDTDWWVYNWVCHYRLSLIYFFSLV